jgi:dUTP pyrophosphatase
MQRKMVATGVQLEIPEGYYGRIAPRSGLALKQGIDVLAGVIDSSYRGEIKVIIFNTDNQKVFKVNVGDRIAQLIIEKHYNFDFVEVEDLETTDRGEGGFGSSGS